MPRRITLGTVLVVVMLLSAGVAWWARSQLHQFSGTLLQNDDPAYDFELRSDRGTVRLSDFRGKWVLLFFGYASCPDVCPTTLADLARVMELLGEDADQLQVIMISVDPYRDTPERLGQYVRAFHPSFLGLTGTPEEIAEVAARYGIYYNYPEGTPESGYVVEHTAATLLVDPEGNLRMIFPSLFGPDALTPEQMAADLKYLMRGP